MSNPPTGTCSCGSGRVFDACCAARAAHDIDIWRRRRETDDRVVRRIVDYARTAWGDQVIAEAIRMFSLGTHSLESLLRALAVLGPWLAYAWVPNWEDEDGEAIFERTAHLPTAPLGISWLASGAQVDDIEQTLVVAASESPHSLLLVEAARPGWSLTVRDLLTDKRFDVVDPEIASRARTEDVLFSAVLTLDGVSTLLGPAEYSAPTDLRYESARIRECYSETEWMTRDEIEHMTEELCSEFRDACDRVRRGRATGQETEDPLRMRWAISDTVHDTVERLRPLTVYYEEDEAIEVEFGRGGEARARLDWYEHGPSDDPDDWEALGTLFAEPGRLTAAVPTRALAARLTMEIDTRLGPAAVALGSCPDGPTRVHSRPPLVAMAVR